MAAVPKRPDGLTELCTTFGDPRLWVDAKEEWEKTRLAIRALPVSLPYAFAPVPVSRVRAHALIVDHLVETLVACLDAGVSRSRLVYGGCYSWRPMRGGIHLSTHTWGIAVDLDPVKNPQGKPWQDDAIMLDRRIIDTFHAKGWKWGNDFVTADPQHFQFVTGY